MRIATVIALLLAATTADVLTQEAASQIPAGPRFDVVSIKPNTSAALGSNGSGPRPDGGLTMLNIPVGVLVGQAYGTPPVDMVGLPAWAISERYDVIATSQLPKPTPEERTSMLRAMLADRFKLVARLEPREQPVYDLVLARADGRLGTGLTKSDVDCEARFAEQRAAAEAALAAGSVPPRPAPPDFNAPVSCSIRMMGDRMEGENTIANMAALFRPAAGRYVIDKTGLTGTYRMVITFDRMAGLRGPDTATTAAGTGAPSIFTAVQEQLGLNLVPSKAMRDTLVIDRLERPTEN